MHKSQSCSPTKPLFKLFCPLFIPPLSFCLFKISVLPQKRLPERYHCQGCPVFGVYRLRPKRRPFLVKILWLSHLHKSHPSETSYISLLALKLLKQTAVQIPPENYVVYTTFSVQKNIFQLSQKSESCVDIDKTCSLQEILLPPMFNKPFTGAMGAEDEERV